MPDDKPPEKPTVPMNQAEIFNARFDKLETVMLSRFDKTDANIDIVSSAVDVVKGRQDLADRRLEALEGRASQNSLRAASASSVDLTHEAAIARVEAKADKALEQGDRIEAKTDAQTVILTEARNAARVIWNDPRFRGAIALLWTGLLYWLGTKGFKVPQ